MFGFANVMQIWEITKNLSIKFVNVIVLKRNDVDVLGQS